MENKYLFKKAALKVLGLLCIVGLCTGCILFAWDREYDIVYDGVIFNSTEYELLVIQGTDTANYHHLDSFYLEPYSNVVFTNEGFYNDDKNIESEFFKFGGYRPPIEQTRVYRNDSLMANWIGPPKYLDNTIHDFYNINCWEQTFDNESNHGEFIFEILSSDLME